MKDDKVGIVFGAFDLLHAGHIMLLEECAKYCDRLIVGLQTDPTIDRPKKNKPIQTVYERLVQVNALSVVNDIVAYSHEIDIIPILLFTRPDIRFLGDDYVHQEFTGKQFCEEHGIDIHYVDRSHGYSSTELRRRIKESK